MMRIQCPECRKTLSVDESKAGAMGVCPACKTRIRITPMPKDVPQQQAPNPVHAGSEEEPSQTVGKQAESGDSYSFASDAVEPAPAKKQLPNEPKKKQPEKRSKDVDEDEGQEEERDDDQEKDEDQEEDEEDRPAPKKKKKKKKSAAGSFVGNFFLSVGTRVIKWVIGMAVAVVVSIVMWFLRGGFMERTSDTDAALAEFKKIGAVVEQDTKSPEKPVLAINFTKTQVNTEHMEWLADFPRLKTLNLSHTSINNLDLEHVQGLTDLETLNLSFTKVSDGGLPWLRNLGKLKVLLLDNTLVTDAGLEKLTGLNRLEKIGLTNTNATGASLKRASPKLQIIR